MAWTRSGSAGTDWVVFVFVCAALAVSAARVWEELARRPRVRRRAAGAAAVVGARKKDPDVLRRGFESGRFSKREASYYEPVPEGSK